MMILCGIWGWPTLKSCKSQRGSHAFVSLVACALQSLSLFIGLYFASSSFLSIQKAYSRDIHHTKIDCLMTLDCASHRYRVNSTSTDVGGTTIKRLSVGDAGDQQESGILSGCLWSPSPASRADFILLVALAKG